MQSVRYCTTANNTLNNPRKLRRQTTMASQQLIRRLLPVYGDLLWTNESASRSMWVLSVHVCVSVLGFCSCLENLLLSCPFRIQSESVTLFCTQQVSVRREGGGFSFPRFSVVCLSVDVVCFQANMVAAQAGRRGGVWNPSGDHGAGGQATYHSPTVCQTQELREAGTPEGHVLSTGGTGGC